MKQINPNSFSNQLQLKICVSLVITASLEVEHGVSNLWSTASTGFKAAADYGQFVPRGYFSAFVCGFPHLWSPQHLWYSDNVPWDCFLPFVEAFNQRRRDLLKTVYLLMDESMSAWRPKTTKTGGLPNITFEPRKPKPLGTMLKNGVCGSNHWYNGDARYCGRSRRAEREKIQWR